MVKISHGSRSTILPSFNLKALHKKFHNFSGNYVEISKITFEDLSANRVQVQIYVNVARKALQDI
jgi:hypothetical protein